MDLQQLKNHRKGFKAALTRKKNHIRELLSSEFSQGLTIEIVTQELDLDEAMSKFRKAHNEYQSHLESSAEIQESLLYFDKELKEFCEFKQEINEWLADHVSPNDSASNVTPQASRVSVGTRSSAVSTSSRSSSSSVLEAKMKASARRAALLVEAASLSKREALAEEKLKLRLREDRLRLETEINKVKAQELAYKEFESETQPSSPFGKTYSCLRSNISTKLSPRPAFSQELFPSTPTQRLFMDESLPHAPVPQPYHLDSAENLGKHSFEFSHADVIERPSRHATDESQHVLQSIQVVQQQVERQLMAHRLPKADLLTFDGNPLNYFLFIRSFENNVEKCTDDQSQRLQLLIQSCTGKAKEIVQGCGMMEANEGYRTARKLLEGRFGDNFLVTNAWITKVADGPVIGFNDREALQDLADDLGNCEIALKVAGRLSQINSDDKLIKIVQRMPSYIRSRWQKAVREIRERGGVPTIADVKRLIAEAAKEKNDPVFGGILDRTSKDYEPRVNTSKKSKTPINQGYSFSTQLAVGKPQCFNSNAAAACTDVRWRCFFCNANHRLADCQGFSRASSQDKLKFVREKRLCENCLSSTHYAGGCKNPNGCKVQDCTFARKHLGVLHSALLALRQDRQESLANRDTSLTAQDGHNAVSMQRQFVGLVNRYTETFSEIKALPIVPVKVKAKGQNEIITVYALLDGGSTSTWCTSDLIDRLNVKGVEVQVSLTTIEQDNIPTESKRVSLEIMDFNENVMIELPEVFSKNKLNISTSGIASQEDVERWLHLKGVHVRNIEGEVELLIGQDAPTALEPIEIIRSKNKGPYATRTSLGWTLNGPLGRHGLAKKGQVHCVQSDVLLSKQFNQFMNLEFVDSLACDGLSMSRNDKRVMSQYDDSVHLVDGHYEIAIPWRASPPSLPNDKPLAEHRLRLLRKRLLKDEKLYQKYSNFMDDLLEKNYARKVPLHRLDRDDGKVWYLPHHSVTHPQKPDKVRIVFDCAAKYHGVSLNDEVLQGPDLSSKLIGVLTRFREEPFCLMSDVESMYHQVRVNPSDIDALRFLWYSNNDLQQEPVEYQMLVHIFGGIWSASCANYALQRTATDNIENYDAQTIETIKKNFYVDDCLKSVGSEDRAVNLVQDLSELLAHGGFRLTKWLSNSRKVINSIPVHEIAKGVKELDLNKESLPVERALGVRWNMESDKFVFLTKPKDKPSTRRGLLSIVSSVFDPIGFACPFILSAKAILRDLTYLGWDDAIPDRVLARWKEWFGGLCELDNFAINRCFKPQEFGNVVFGQLHNFADASEIGYGAVSYLRLIDDKGNISCAFVFAKSRIAPLKPVTIPRLELSAATVAVRLDQMIKREIDLKLDESVFWTDSTAVLGYIRNQDKRYQTFVANRLEFIHNGSRPDQWKYISTKTNPADVASRGITADKLLNNVSWFHGPDFLSKHEQMWPAQPSLQNKVPADDPEVKPNAVHYLAHGALRAAETLNRLFQRYSTWNKLRKSLAWILRFKDWLLSKVRQRSKRENVENTTMLRGKITTDEIQYAEQEIIKYIQKQFFKDELSSITKGNAKSSRIKKSSPVFNLDPILSESILRVGGRLRKAQLQFNAMHPVILPKHHPVVDLLIRHYHVISGHSGQEYVLSLLREHYWILKARVSVRKMLRNCFECKRRQQVPGKQRMADLPADRVTPSKPPFTFAGVDCFGPFYVKRGRSTVKRYGVIFTCLAIRAIHIEIAHSLDTSSFINALRRFMARRGKPEEMRSDNGGNFKAAEKEIKQEIKNWNQEQIHEFLLQRDVRWSFNPPFASHMGGVWERPIRTVRKVMSALVKEQVLDDEGLSTLMCEVECIINGRPLTKVSDDPKDLQALTPNHLLLLRGSPDLPPGVFKKEDVFSIRRWRQVQYLTDVFWHRWLREYLPSLQERSKWQTSQRNLAVGDLVLLVDENAPRCVWFLARVLELHPNEDGCVRQVKVKTRSGIFTRPVHKLCLLENI